MYKLQTTDSADITDFKSVKFVESVALLFLRLFFAGIQGCEMEIVLPAGDIAEDRGDQQRDR